MRVNLNTNGLNILFVPSAFDKSMCALNVRALCAFRATFNLTGVLIETHNSKIKTEKSSKKTNKRKNSKRKSDRQREEKEKENKRRHIKKLFAVWI